MLVLAAWTTADPTVAELAGLPPPPEVDGVSLVPAFLSTGSLAPDLVNKTYAFSEFPQCPGTHLTYGGPAEKPLANLWHTDEGCQSVRPMPDVSYCFCGGKIAWKSAHRDANVPTPHHRCFVRILDFSASVFGAKTFATRNGTRGTG
eukprot:SAG11_NODE_5171_length_1641_cov_0.921530_1_plen_147_part_00